MTITLKAVTGETLETRAFATLGGLAVTPLWEDVEKKRHRRRFRISHVASGLAVSSGNRQLFRRARDARACMEALVLRYPGLWERSAADITAIAPKSSFVKKECNRIMDVYATASGKGGCDNDGIRRVR